MKHCPLSIFIGKLKFFDIFLIVTDNKTFKQEHMYRNCMQVTVHNDAEKEGSKSSHHCPCPVLCKSSVQKVSLVVDVFRLWTVFYSSSCYNVIDILAYSFGNIEAFSIKNMIIRFVQSFTNLHQVSKKEMVSVDSLYWFDQLILNSCIRF